MRQADDLRTLRRRQLRVSAAATGYDSHIFDLLASASAQIDTDTAVILLCHDLNRNSPVLQAAREAKPFYLGALGSYRTHTLRLSLAKAPRAGMVQGGNNANPGTRRDIPQSPGCAYSGTLRAGRSRLCTSPSGGGFRPAPVVLILAAGRGERFLASGGNTHKRMRGRQSPEVAPYRWPFEENGRTFDLAIEPQITTNDFASDVEAGSCRRRNNNCHSGNFQAIY